MENTSTDIRAWREMMDRQETAESGAFTGGQSGPPAGVAVFAADTTIRSLMDPSGRVSHWSEYGTGGHFPAMEVPDLLAGDIRAFFRDLR